MENSFNPRRRPSDTRIVLGAIVIGLGVILLMQMFDLIPHYFISYHFFGPVTLIVIGVLIGARSGFRNIASWILIVIGIANLVQPFRIGDVDSNDLAKPALLVLIGLFIIFRRRRPKAFVTPPPAYQARSYANLSSTDRVVNSDSSLNIEVVFGGRKEIVTSKNFRGGTISATFAGAEVNLSQADGQEQPMILDIRVAFGGVEMVVPSHWEIRNEIRPVMGSVEDHRMIYTGSDPLTEKRVLILRGNCFCGSVEIKSY